MVERSYDDSPFPDTRVMRISDVDVKVLFLGSMSRGRPGWASRGLPARWATRPAGRATRCSTSGRHGYLPTSPRPGAKDACPGCCPPWNARGY